MLGVAWASGERPHGLSFSGAEGTLIVDASGFEVIPEPKKKSLGSLKAHARSVTTAARKGGRRS
jgi:hypothetical protein